MAKKRGGVAGFYDRNKGFLRAAVPAALSFVPGVGIPLAAAAGAAMRGMDRPGQRGIGFNAFEGLKGGIQGAAMGAGAQGARALLTGGGPMAGMMGRGAALPQAKMTVGMTPGMGGITQPVSAAVTGGGGTAGGLGEGVRSLLAGARENKDLIAMAGKGIMSAMPQPGEEAAMMNAETQRMRLEEEQRQTEQEQERRRRIAELLMPYARQAFGSAYPGMTP